MIPTSSTSAGLSQLCSDDPYDDYGLSQCQLGRVCFVSLPGFRGVGLTLIMTGSFRQLLWNPDACSRVLTTWMDALKKIRFHAVFKVARQQCSVILSRFARSHAQWQLAVNVAGIPGRREVSSRSGLFHRSNAYRLPKVHVGLHTQLRWLCQAPQS